MSEEEMISEIEIYLSHVIAKDFPFPKAVKLMYEEYKNSKKNWEKIYDEDQNYIGELNDKIFDLEFEVKNLQKEIEELKYHIHYKICAWCGDEFKTKIHNARYCPKCRETKRREIRISNCKKHYENNKEYFKNYYQNLTDEQKEKRRANNREANRRLRERKKANEQRRKEI